MERPPVGGRRHAIIDAEKCVRDWNGPWCDTHDGHWPDSAEVCEQSPADLADVAAQLLATMERVESLLDEADRWKPYPSRDIGDAYLAESVTDFWAEIRAAINGEEVTE